MDAIYNALMSDVTTLLKSPLHKKGFIDYLACIEYETQCLATDSNDDYINSLVA